MLSVQRKSDFHGRRKKKLKSLYNQNPISIGFWGDYIFEKAKFKFSVIEIMKSISEF